MTPKRCNFWKFLQISKKTTPQIEINKNRNDESFTEESQRLLKLIEENQTSFKKKYENDSIKSNNTLPNYEEINKVINDSVALTHKFDKFINDKLKKIESEIIEHIEKIELQKKNYKIKITQIENASNNDNQVLFDNVYISQTALLIYQIKQSIILLDLYKTERTIIMQSLLWSMFNYSKMIQFELSIDKKGVFKQSLFESVSDTEFLESLLSLISNPDTKEWLCNFLKSSSIFYMRYKKEALSKYNEGLKEFYLWNIDMLKFSNKIIEETIIA